MYVFSTLMTFLPERKKNLFVLVTSFYVTFNTRLKKDGHREDKRSPGANVVPGDGKATNLPA